MRSAIRVLPALIEQSRLAGLNVHYQSTGDGSAVNDAAGLCLYRIVQESLANIAKHARLAGMTARAEQMGAQLRTGVDDDDWLVDLILPAVDHSATPAVTT